MLQAEKVCVGALYSDLAKDVWLTVLEAKKKAEEHNDGAGVTDGRDAPEQPGMLD